MNIRITKYHVIYKLIIICLSASITSFAQDPVFSQYYNAPLNLNPAFAGLSYNPVVSATHRNQWPNLGNVYTTYNLNYDQYIERLNSGFGLGILTDNQGDGSLLSTKVSGMYAYGIQVDRKHQLRIGIGFGFVQQRLNWSKLIFGDQISKAAGIITQGGTVIPSVENMGSVNLINYLDISTGFLFSGPQYYFGLSLDHINSPDRSFLDSNLSSTAVPLRISLHGGYQINFRRGNKRDEGSFLTPNLLFERQGDFYQLNIGAYTSYKKFFLGLWYRNTWNNNDAIIASIGIKRGPFKVGYSYDYTISALSIGSGGSHEIGLLVDLFGDRYKKSNLNDCFALFR